MLLKRTKILICIHTIYNNSNSNSNHSVSGPFLYHFYIIATQITALLATVIIPFTLNSGDSR